MLTLFHVGPKGFNVGNDAITEGIHTLIRERFGRIVNVISIPATARFEAHGRAGLTPGVIHEINQYGDGVILGGGNLLENGQLTVDVNALQALAVPMLMLSVSWGRIYDRGGALVRRTDSIPDNVAHALVAASAVVVARDSATMNYLDGVGAKGVRLGGCPTLFLDQVVDRLPQIPESDANRVLVSVRSPHLMNIPLAMQQRTPRDIAEILALLRDRGEEPVLLCHDHRDVPFAASFQGTEFIYIQNVYEYLALLKAAKINVTYRLHSALPCLVMGTPFVKLSYDERSVSLMETIGLDEWNINLMNTANVAQAVGDRLGQLGDLDDIIGRSVDTRDRLRDVMRSSIDDFRRAVGA